jgi:UDP-3-O-[3-hydroxymyristoyl] glucosamine N-acyltransferase
MTKKGRIDPSAFIHPTAFVNDCVRVGKNVKIGPNCSIGYEGFQWHRDKNEVPVYTEHFGGVILEDGVEMGANCSVGRAIGHGENTVLRRNVKLDNLIFVPHNCDIGEGTLISAGVIFGGSVRVGKTNFFGLNCTLKPKITIGDCNLVGMGAVVLRDIPDHEIWAGNPARKLRDNLMFKRPRKGGK